MSDLSTAAISALRSSAAQEQAPVVLKGSFKPKEADTASVPPPRRDSQDRVEISDAARAAASKTPLPRTDSVGQAPDDLRFSYNPSTNTLQTQVVNARTGKPVVEIPSDEQIKLQETLQEIFQQKSAERGGQPSSEIAGDFGGAT